MKLIPLVVFVGGFALYLFSSAPALAPYRDMGEMVSVSHTLGIAHPPGYPTYTLLGKISTLFPLANQSYRVNLVSVLGGALSGLLLALALLRLKMSKFSVLLSVFLWLSASGVWVVSIVTEMYSLNLAAAALLLYLWSQAQENCSFRLPVRFFYLAAFLLGVSLGIRLDLILLLPALLICGVFLLWKFGKSKILFKTLLGSVLFGLLGFSIFLYLPLRSKQKPYLNWNRPETIEKMWSSLTRKTHGGTLDLLSVNYAPGELFWTDFKIYLKDAAKQFTWFGALCAVVGIYFLAKNNLFLFVFTLLGWVFTGPFFIYKANMPPNPHALAILEAHFLLPNIFVALWVAFGLDFILAKIPSKKFHLLSTIFLSALAVLHLYFRWEKVSKRYNFFGLDYAKNIFRTVPSGSVVVMHEDVQLFSFWALQYAEKVRPDVAVVARGLAGSSWYIQMRQEEGLAVKLGPLRSETDFIRFLADNPERRFFTGWDQDVPYSEKYRQIPRGLVREITTPSSTPLYSPLRRGKEKESGGEEAGEDFLEEFYVYRGEYNYQKAKDFFSSDLIEDYSKAHFAKGVEFSKLPPLPLPRAFGKKERGMDLAIKEWNRAIALNSENGTFYYRRAFLFMHQNQLDLARRDFLLAEKLLEKTYQQTQQYHSLPDVVKGVVAEWTDALLNLGVTYEKLGKIEESEQSYLKALKIEHRLPRAHYNLAVLYWNRDWPKVVHHLQQALQIDPNYEQAKIFLPKAQYALQMSGSRQSNAPF